MGSGDKNQAIVNDGDSATINVLLSAFNDLNIEDVIGKKQAFINFTSNVLIKQLPPISPEQLVIELLEDQEATPELLKALTRLRKQGYKIALDDFCLTKDTLSLIDYADIIKFDVLQQAPQSWRSYFPKLKAKGITLLAEKVETNDMYELCRDLGFDLFQGYFFAKPKIITGKRISNNELTILNLLSKLNAKDVDITEITNIISGDTNLSYNLLRTINSGLFNLPAKVDSIKRAITLLGLSHLKRWINFLSLSSMDNKPQALTETAMIRSKMCEELGKLITGRDTVDDYFTVGMLSLIDTFFNTPMAELLKKLDLPDMMEDALLKHTGEMGEALACVIHYQNQNWAAIKATDLISSGLLSWKDITQSYLESVKWLDENAMSTQPQ